MVSRVVTGAHYGLRDWLLQRITAVVMAVYSVVILVWFLLQPTLNDEVWTGLFANQLVRSITLLFLACLFYHAWVGVRDIVMDYIKPASVRLVVHVLVILVLLLYVIWSAQILWGI